MLKINLLFIIISTYSVRKNADELKKALENVVVPMFCCTSIGLPEDQLAKINKVMFTLLLRAII